MTGLIKSHRAAAAIGAYLIVKYAAPSTDDTITGAAADTDPVLGVTGQIGGDAAGRMVDVTVSGLAEVRLGGTVTAGAPLMANADSEAVAAVASAGDTVRIVGFARAPGVDGDIIPLLVAPGLLHEPT